MKIYNTLYNIKNDFNIETDDLQIIREKLNEIRINNHPDKTKGVFINKESEEKFINSNNAIEYIDSVKNNHSLIVVEKMTDLIKVFTEITDNKQKSLEQNLDNKITNTISTFKSKLFLPKVSLTMITAVLTFIFFFPNQIKENPILSNFIQPSSKEFAYAWFIALIYSSIFWIMAYSNEEKSKKRLTLLKVDSIQNKIFDDFINQKTPNGKFLKDDLTNFIYNQVHNNNLERNSNSSFILSKINNKLFGSEIITLEISQSIAEIIITRAEKNNIIEKTNNNTLSETYFIKNYC